MLLFRQSVWFWCSLGECLAFKIPFKGFKNMLYYAYLLKNKIWFNKKKCLHYLEKYPRFAKKNQSPICNNYCIIWNMTSFFSCLPYQKPACTRYHPIRVTVIFISDNGCYKQSVLELCRVELILLNDLCLQRYKETQKAHHIIDHKNSQSYDILMSSKAD